MNSDLFLGLRRGEVRTKTMRSSLGLGNCMLQLWQYENNGCEPYFIYFPCGWSAARSEFVRCSETATLWKSLFLQDGFQQDRGVSHQKTDKKVKDYLDVDVIHALKSSSVSLWSLMRLTYCPCLNDASKGIFKAVESFYAFAKSQVSYGLV